jgi:hypothetical protein
MLQPAELADAVSAAAVRGAFDGSCQFRLPNSLVYHVLMTAWMRIMRVVLALVGRGEHSSDWAACRCERHIPQTTWRGGSLAARGATCCWSTAGGQTSARDGPSCRLSRTLKRTSIGEHARSAFLGFNLKRAQVQDDRGRRRRDGVRPPEGASRCCAIEMTPVAADAEVVAASPHGGACGSAGVDSEAAVGRVGRACRSGVACVGAETGVKMRAYAAHVCVRRRLL